MRSVYLCEQGAKVSLEGERLLVTGNEETSCELHLYKIDSLLVFGNISFTTPVVSALLERRIPTSFFTTNGRFKGIMAPIKSKNIDLRLSQYALHLDNLYCTEFSKTIVSAKIQNQVSVLRRYQYNHAELSFDDTVQTLQRLLKKTMQSTRIESLLGIEGYATRAYFRAYAKMFRNELSFHKRTKHPALDPANALLSFGYTLLAREISGYIETVGLDPYLGFYHQTRYGRLSLTYDILEPFRQPVIDRFILLLANKKMIATDDFIKTKDGVRLKHKPLKRFLKQYELWMNRPMKKLNGLPFRKILFDHCARFQHAIAHKTQYVPFIFK